jgi:hypothetical protein
VLYRPLIGQSKYNAAQATLRKTFSHGLSATGSVAWSKAFDMGGTGNNANAGGSAVQDIYNLKAGYSLSGFDVPKRVTALFSYEVPLARRKWYGGWQVSGSVLWQSGTPILPYAATFLNFAAVRPDRVAGVPAGLPRDQMQANIRHDLPAFNVNAFVQPGQYMFGTAARAYNDLRRDSYKNVSLSTLKNFTLREGRLRAQLRGEFLNAFNMVVFGSPGTDVTNRDLVQNGVLIRKGTFGRVTGQGNLPRSIQLVMRVTF